MSIAEIVGKFLNTSEIAKAENKLQKMMALPADQYDLAYMPEDMHLAQAHLLQEQLVPLMRIGLIGVGVIGAVVLLAQ